MPCRVDVDRDGGIVWLTASGLLTPEEIVEGLHAMVCDPGFEPGMPQLLDLRDVTDLPLGDAELRGIAARAAQLGPRLGSGRLALWAEQPFVYGLARMYAAIAQTAPVEVRTFRDQGEAMAWLRSDPDPSQRAGGRVGRTVPAASS